MAIPNTVRFGWSLAGGLLCAAAWVACVDMAGSRTDVALGLVDDEAGAGSGNDSGVVGAGSSSSSSSGGPGPGSGVDAAPPTPDLCGFPTTTASMPILYAGVPSGAAETCVTSIPAPRSGTWFSYHDATDDGGLTVTGGAGRGGCGGTSICAYHAYGPTEDAGTGFSIYGAGVGFDLNDVNGSPTNYDAMAAGYSGIQFWAKGTSTGTRGPGYVLSPQTIHLKLVTATDRHGDDYGSYCTMVDPTNWTLCKLDFSAAKRDGFSTTPDPTTDMFDYDQLQKVQFELSLYTAPAGTAPPLPTVMFDIWVDEVSFY